MIEFDQFIRQEFKGQKFIAHCYEGEKPLLKNVLKPGEDALVLIGPEGDFSEEEVKKAIERGFVPISLGKSRLRTETAVEESQFVKTYFGSFLCKPFVAVHILRWCHVNV